MEPGSEAASIHPIPAEWRDCGFRLLVLRQYHAEVGPPAFAWIEQRLLRMPQRFTRHGMFFANTFLPEIVAWLDERLGRPSLRDADDRPQRNPRWPVMSWHGENRVWPDGSRTTEWFVDVSFDHETTWSAFRERWLARLGIESEQKELAT